MIERDYRLTGIYREQTDNVAAPLGFDVNNGWKVRTPWEWLDTRLADESTARGQNHIVTLNGLRAVYLRLAAGGATNGYLLHGEF